MHGGGGSHDFAGVTSPDGGGNAGGDSAGRSTSTNGNGGGGGAGGVGESVNNPPYPNAGKAGNGGIGLNSSIISNAPLTPCSSYIF